MTELWLLRTIKCMFQEVIQHQIFLWLQKYDATTNTVFIAEVANGASRVLAFTNVAARGNISPSINNSLSQASSLFFYSSN